MGHAYFTCVSPSKVERIIYDIPSLTLDHKNLLSSSEELNRFLWFNFLLALMDGCGKTMSSVWLMHKVRFIRRMFPLQKNKKYIDWGG